MKKYALIFALLTFVFGYSQKRVIVYNYTSATMKIYGVVTKPIASGATFPYCYGYRVGLGTGESLILENNSNVNKFPFYSPVTTPTIINDLSWTRVTATGSTSNISGLTLWNTLGTTQEFNYIEFGHPGITGPGAGGQIGISTPGGHYENILAGFQADYYRFNLSATEYEDWIVFADL